MPSFRLNCQYGTQYFAILQDVPLPDCCAKCLLCVKWDVKLYSLTHSLVQNVQSIDVVLLLI